MDNIEDLVLDDSISIPEDIDYQFIKDKVDEIASKLQEEIKDSFEIKTALKDMHTILVKHPTMVHELMPEDIGVLSNAIMEVTNKYIATQTSKKKKKASSKVMSASKAAEILSEGIPDDF